MRYSSAFAIALLLAGAAALWQAPGASGQADAGWTVLFDGKSLDNWTRIGDANWRIEDGAVVADKASGISYLVSKTTYTDFQIRSEFWVDDEANSGIFIRCIDPKKINGMTAYEVNIYDKRPDPAYGTGGIPNVAKALVPLKAGGKWNTYEILAKGPKFTVTLNGTRTVDGAEDAKFPSGHIALQYGQGIVKFRKVDIKPL
jgi:hypothetical protein